MIYYVNIDIFDSGAQVLVNPVNIVGVMGKGLALEFKKRYPRMFSVYREACNSRTLKIGKLMLVEENGQRILLFPTKNHWSQPAKIECIEKGLIKFVETYKKKGINSIAFPKLGCGYGGLNWNKVKPLMESYLKDLPIEIYICI